MGRIIGDNPPDLPERKYGALGLHINGQLYTNSAAQFWSNLLDEIHEDFDSCNSVELIAMGSSTLTRAQLHPANSLQDELKALAGMDITQVLKDAVSELELIGPPGPIRIRILNNGRELIAKNLSTDCVDAEIFPFLATWLLEWGQVPDFYWNNASVESQLKADDWGRGFVYTIDMRLATEHVSEGLLSRTLQITFERTKAH